MALDVLRNLLKNIFPGRRKLGFLPRNMTDHAGLRQEEESSIVEDAPEVVKKPLMEAEMVPQLCLPSQRTKRVPFNV